MPVDLNPLQTPHYCDNQVATKDKYDAQLMFAW